MKKSLILSFVLGLIGLQGCSSTLTTCKTSTDCAGNSAGAVCNTTSGKCVFCMVNADCKAAATPACVANACVAETASACATNAFCGSISAGNTCSATTSGTCVCGTGAACASWQTCTAATSTCTALPRYVFLTSNQYTLGTAYNATTSPKTFASVSDANTICSAEYQSFLKANPTLGFPTVATFVAVLATPNTSIFGNIGSSVANPRPIFPLENQQNKPVAASTLIQIAAPIAASPDAACSSFKGATGIFPPFDCLATNSATGSIQNFQVPSLGPLRQAFFTGAPLSSSGIFTFTTASDTTGFYSTGTASSTCSNWSSSTGTGLALANDGGVTWSSYGTNNACATASLLMCIQTD